MKVKVGSFFVDASGKLGGAQLGRNNGQMIMQSKSNANKSPSSLQQLQRNRTQLIMANWSNLSNANRLLWIENAKSYTRNNVFNDIKKINGFELFNIVNQNRLRLGLTLMSTPAAHNVPNPPYTVTVTSSETEITLFSDAYDSNTFVDVYVSPVISKGMSNPKKYLRRLITLTAAELASGYDIFTEYTERYGSVSNGDNLFLGIKTISNVSYYSSKKITVNKPVIVIGGTTPPVYDADAQAFIDAVGTLTTTQEVAINNLVLGLKSNGTWSKYKVIYPFIGSTASAHKWNLKDPRDLDAAFRLTFNGTITHDANGITGDGSTGYGDTHFTKNDGWSSINVGYSIYSRTAISEESVDIGVQGVSGRISNHLSWSNGNLYSDIFNITNGRIQIVGALDSKAFYGFYQNGGTDNRIYRNGVQYGSTNTNNATASFVDVPTDPLYVLAANNSGAVDFSTRNLAFISISDAFTPSEVANDYTIVQAYQTALGRNV